jgi:hypothetical protein
MADPITLAAAGVMAGGTLLGGEMKASAEEDMGRMAREGAEYQAKQQEGAAAEAFASSQRQAFEKQRLGRLALSTLQNRAAAGGGRPTDETILQLTEDIAGRSEYEALGDLYTGENRARGLRDQAAADRYSGRAKEYGANASARATRVGSYFDAAGTLLSGYGASKTKLARGRGYQRYGNPLGFG